MKKLCLWILITAMPPLPAQSPVPAHIIIWGGGKTRNDALDALRSWTQLQPLLKSYGLADNESRKVMQSDGQPGLKPGFWIYTVGFCHSGKVKNVLKNLKRLHPGVYARPTTVISADMLNSCPSLKSSPPLKSWNMGVHRLEVFTAGPVVLPRKPEPGPPCERKIKEFYVLLKDKRSHLVTHAVTVEGDATVSGFCDDGAPTSYSCNHKSIKKTAAGMEFLRACRADGSEGSGSLMASDEVSAVSIRGSEIHVQQSRKNKVLDP